MNWGGVFALFGFPDDEGGSKDNKKIKEELEAYKETPYFKLGMFHRIDFHILYIVCYFFR